MKSPQFYLFIAVLWFFSFSSQASVQGSLQDFELVVVESLPDGLSLDMSLEEIIQIKHQSRLSESKRKFFQRATKALEVALRSRQASDADNLVDLVKSVPIQEIVDNILKSEEASFLESTAMAPFDFSIFVFPKAAKLGSGDGNAVDYGNLYAGAQTSLIDAVGDSSFKAQSYNQKVNFRLSKAAHELYKKQYLENPASPQSFFVGGMLNIHLAGPRSSARFQVLGGLPTGLSKEIVLDKKEAFFQSVNSPKIPTRETIESADFPGVILSLDYRPTQTQVNQTDDSQLVLGVVFGSLATVGEMEWLPGDHLTRLQGPPKAGLARGWRDWRNWTKGYNVPHLIGALVKEEYVSQPGGLDGTLPRTALTNIKRTYAEPSGNKWIDSYLVRFHQLQVNIHELSIDLITKQVLDVRVTLEFPPISFFSLPVLVMPSVGEEIKSAANQELEKAVNQANHPIRAVVERFYAKELQIDGDGGDKVTLEEIKNAVGEGVLEFINGIQKGGL